MMAATIFLSIAKDSIGSEFRRRKRGHRHQAVADRTVLIQVPYQHTCKLEIDLALRAGMRSDINV